MSKFTAFCGEGISTGLFAFSLSALLGGSAYFLTMLDMAPHAKDALPQILLGGFAFINALLFSLEIARRGLSCLSVFHYFMFCFFGLMPLLYFRSGYWLFGDISKDNASGIIKVSLLGYLFTAVFLCVYYSVARRYTSVGSVRLPAWLAARSLNYKLVPLLLVVQVCVIAFVVVSLGWNVLFFRGGTADIGFASFWVVVILYFIRPMALFCFAIYLVDCRGRWSPGRYLYCAILGIVALLANFPTSVARFYLFAVLTVVVFCLFSKGRFWRYVSLALMLVGFLGGVVSDQFRFIKGAADLKRITAVDMEGYLTAGHFDAFEMNAYGLDYVEQYGLERGRQLTGTLGFWVPRFLWPNKPVPSGALLGSGFIGIMESTKNTNLSFPLPAEGYIDFGVVGVILYALIFGAIFAVVDRIGRLYLMASGRYGSLFSIIFPGVVTGMVLYLMRGALMPALAYSLGVFFSCVVIYMVFTKPNEVAGRRTLKS